MLTRFETFIALVAVVLASVAALQVPGRILFALTAILLFVFLAGRMLRAAIKGRVAKRSGFSAAERAAQIREERSRRLDHR